MVTLYNPLSEDISVQIIGLPYTIKAKSTLEVPKEVAEYWTVFLHKFLEILPPEKESKATTESKVVTETKSEKTTK